MNVNYEPTTGRTVPKGHASLCRTMMIHGDNTPQELADDLLEQHNFVMTAIKLGLTITAGTDGSTNNWLDIHANGTIDKIILMVEAFPGKPFFVDFHDLEDCGKFQQSRGLPGFWRFTNITTGVL